MGKLKRQHSSSSLITSIAYDKAKKILEIVFCQGGIYEYQKVGKRKYLKLISSPSTGEYFNKNIRGVHTYERVRE